MILIHLAKFACGGALSVESDLRPLRRTRKKGVTFCSLADISFVAAAKGATLTACPTRNQFFDT
jgi:hypothetical protein